MVQHYSNANYVKHQADYVKHYNKTHVNNTQNTSIYNDTTCICDIIMDSIAWIEGLILGIIIGCDDSEKNKEYADELWQGFEFGKIEAKWVKNKH